MFVTNSSAVVPETPAIDHGEAQWAVEYLSLMIDRLDPESPVTLILRQTRRELVSLTQHSGATVLGPIRIAA
jgi:hypothetical protein